MDIDTEISRVTVYSDRAMVSRKAQITLEVGTHVLRMAPLPQDLDTESLQVGGGKGALLLDVKTKIYATEETLDPQWDQIQKELGELDEELKVYSDKTNEIKAEKDFVSRISLKLTSGEAGKPLPQEFGPEGWMAMVEYYRKKMSQLNEELRNVTIERRKTEKTISVIGERQALLNQNQSIKHQSVEVSVEVTEPGSITLEVSYLVYRAQWNPLYDLRVNPVKRSLELVYNGSISQSTGEDWSNALIYLSTARPQIGGNLPSLSPHRLGVRSASREIRNYSKARTSMKRDFRADVEEEEEGVLMAMSRAEPMMEAKEVVVDLNQSSGSSVVFQLGSKGDIPSDGEPHQMTIYRGESPAEFLFQTIPKLSPFVFLKAKVKNSTEIPYLPGTTRIFLGNSYVAEGSIPFIAPGENFIVDLGVDETMKASRTLVRRYDASAGLLGQKKRIEYSWRIDLENKKTTPEAITLFDQIPLSSHQDIVVKVLEPDLKGAEYKGPEGEVPTAPGPTVEESGRVTWNISLQPGEKRSLPLVWQVEHPPTLPISGLD